MDYAEEMPCGCCNGEIGSRGSRFLSHFWPRGEFTQSAAARLVAVLGHRRGCFSASVAGSSALGWMVQQFSGLVAAERPGRHVGVCRTWHR